MFKFRLQTVLDLRFTELDSAERDYLLAKSKREDSERDLQGIHSILNDSRQTNRGTFQARLDAEAYRSRLEDEARGMQSAIAVLVDEEERAMTLWIEAKKEVKAIEKLKESAQNEYDLDQNRKEQAELDEWVSMRRAAA